MIETSGKERSQADMNYEAFRSMLPELFANHAGKMALMRDGQVVEFFDSFSDAMKYGESKFGDVSKFSIQEVTNRTPTLGFYDRAVSHIH